VIEQILRRSLARDFVESRQSLLKIRENKLFGKVSSTRSNGVPRASQSVVRALHQIDVPQIADHGAIPRRLSIQCRRQTLAKRVEADTGLC
jgi:hypothetical protein